MITAENRIVTQLLSAIYKDKDNPTVLRVNVGTVVNILSNFGYNVPSNIFEKKLEELLNTKLVGANITPAVNYAVAQLILSLADKVHIREEDIVNYLTTHNTEEDVKKIQDKIKDWRKEYYGAMSKNEKQALVDALQDKLRPEVLDQIKRA